MPLKHIKPFCLFTLLGLLTCTAALAQTTGTFTDPRDGQTYKTISFENVLMGTSTTWMAQNLNYKVSGSYAYDNNENFRKGLGLLYTWEAAKKACPNGWHLATDTEWSVLVNEFGGDNEAGKALKAEKGWNNNGNGTNSSGFSGLPAGFRSTDGSFAFLGEDGYWWSSSAAGEGKAWRRGLLYDSSKVFRFDLNVTVGFSVRCVRD